MPLVGLNRAGLCRAGTDFGLHRTLSLGRSLPLLLATLVPYQATSSQVNSTVWDFDYCASCFHSPLAHNQQGRTLSDGGQWKDTLNWVKAFTVYLWCPREETRALWNIPGAGGRPFRECFIQAWRMKRMKMRASKSFGHWAERKENTPSMLCYDKWIFPFAVGSRKTRAGWVF